MKLISYYEWFNYTLYFQGPIHPDCLHFGDPILYPNDPYILRV